MEQPQVPEFDVWYGNMARRTIGNYNCGKMSAWYVMATLGIHPFDHSIGELHHSLPRAQLAVINMQDNMNPDISRKTGHAVLLHGPLLNRFTIQHKEIANGGTLKF